MSNSLAKIDTIELAGQDLVSFYYGGQIIFACKFTSIPDLIVQGQTNQESNILFVRGNSGEINMDVKFVETIITPAYGTQTYTPLGTSGFSADDVTTRAIEIYDYLVHYVFQACCGPLGGPSEGTVTSVGFNVDGAVTALEVLGGPITSSGAFVLNFLGSDTQYVRGDGTLASFPVTGQGPITWLWDGDLIGAAGLVTSVDFTGSAVNDVSYASGVLTVNILGGSGGTAEWGSIGAGTGVGSQTDLVTYLGQNYIPLAGTLTGYPVTGNIEMLDNYDVLYFANDVASDYKEGITFASQSLNLFCGVYDQSQTSNISLNNAGVIQINSSFSTFEGATYAADYSANFVDRSLVDKAYVDSVAGGAFIPLSGTTVGNPVTGSVAFDIGSGASLTFVDGSTDLASLFVVAGPQLIVQDITGSAFGFSINGGSLTDIRNYIAPDANGTLVLSVNGTAPDASGNVTISAGGLPSQTGHAGEWLTTDGTTASWDALSGNVSLFTNDAGYITGSALTPYVPYTGATTDVDLGTHILNARSIHAKGTGGNGHLGLKHQSANATAAGSESVLFANSAGDMKWKNDGGFYNTFVTSGITADRTYTFKDASGTVAFTSDIPSITPAALTKTDDTNVTLSLGGTPATSLLQAVSLTLGWTGTLSIARGGTNSSTALANDKVMVSTSGAIVESSTTTTQLSYLDATSSIQTQINNLNSYVLSPFKSNTDIVHTGTTAETKVFSQLIPAGTMSANDMIDYVVKFAPSATANAKTIKVYFNTSDALSGATLFATYGGSTIATRYAGLQRKIIFKNSLSSQQILLSTQPAALNEDTTTTVASETKSQNFAVDQYFIVSIQLANSADTVTINSILSKTYR